MTRDPISALIGNALSSGALRVEYRPELRGAQEIVPARFVLLSSLNGVSVRIGEVDAAPFVLNRMAPPHVRIA